MHNFKTTFAYLSICFSFVFISFRSLSQETCASAVTVADLTGVVCATGAAGAVDNLAFASCEEGTLEAFYTFVAQGPNATVVVTSSVSGFRPEFFLMESSDNTCTGAFTYSTLNCFDGVGNYLTLTGAATSLTPGKRYWVVVSSNGDVTTGTLNVCVTNPASPANDDCAGAITLTPGASCVATAGTILNATETLIACTGTAGQDVWYKFVATNTHHNINVVGSASFDAVVEVFSVSCAGTSLSCTDGTIGFGTTENVYLTTLTIGSTYWVRVYDWYTAEPATSTFTICVTTPPANDLCTNATVVVPDGTCYPGTTVSANDDLTAGTWGCQAGADPEVWYTFVSTGSVANFVVTNGTMTGNAEIVIFTNNCVDPLTGINSSCGTSPFTTSINGLLAGTTYYYTISSSTASQGTFTTCLTTTTPPVLSGQDCSTAAVLCSSTTIVEAASAAGYGTQEINAANSCWVSGGERQSKWYKFTAGNAGTLEFNLHPNVLTDDYDWAIFDVTTLGCPTTSSAVQSAIACNWYGIVGTNGSTGMSSCATICTPSELDAQDFNAAAGCQAYAWQNTTTGLYTPLTLVAGHTYALLIDNFVSSNSGYSLTFGGACGGGTVILGPSATFSYALTAAPPCATYSFTKTIATTNSTYNWTFGDGTSSTAASPSHSYAAGGSYTVTFTVTDALGCSKSTSQIITVPIADAGSDISICSAATGNLGAASVGGYTYLWSPTTGLSSSIIANPTVTLTNLTNAATTAVYTLTATSGGVCMTDAVTVTIKPKPQIPSPQTATVCSGFMFTVLPVNGVPTAATVVPASTTYTWAAPVVTGAMTDGASATAQSSITGTLTNITAASQTATYTVTPTSNSCSGTAFTLIATINPLPTYSLAGTNPTTCLGSDGFITVSGLLASTNYNITYNDGAVPVVFPLTLSSVGGVITIPSLNAGAYTTFSVQVASTLCSTANLVGVTLIDPGAPVVAAITGTLNVCVGSTTTLADLTPAGVWSSASPLVATNAAGVITGVNAGTSVISYTVTIGCPTTVTTTVTVYAMPVVAAITGTLNVCVGSSTTLADVTVGGIWSSASPLIATNVAGVITGVSPGTSLISYAVTTNGCTTTANATVTVNAMPVVAPITGTLSVCVGSTTTLADVTAAGSWTSASPLIATNVAGLITGVFPGTSLISYAVTTAGCTTTSTATVTVNAMPVVAAITGTLNVCVGSTTQLADATASGVWASVSPAVATISLTGLVSGLTVGTSVINYPVTISGCSTNATTTVTVNAMPVVAPITGTLNVCVGSTTQLADATASGVWASVTPAVATISLTGLVSGLTVGTSVINYPVTISGCTTNATTTVTVNAMPVVAAITGTLNVCVGSTTQLSDATASGVWTSVTPAVATISLTGLVSGVTPGTSVIDYPVTINGCTTTATTTVSVFAMPVVAPITGVLNVCEGLTSPLADATPSGVWASVSSSIATISVTGVVSGIAAGTSVINYPVTISGCTTNATVTVTVIALPIVAPITGITSVCVGSTTPLADVSVGGVWVSASPAIATIDVGGIVTGISAGTSVIGYPVTANGCTATATTIVTVIALPIVAPITGTLNVCEGLSTQLTDVTALGVWTSASPLIASINTSGNVSGLSFGTSLMTYTVTISGCTSISTTTVNVNQMPTAPLVSKDTTYCSIDTPSNLVSASGFGGTLIWYSDVLLNDSIGTGITLIPSMIVGTNSYYVTETLNGCESPASLSIQILNFCDIEIPTAFTPDGNLVNDTWELAFIDKAYPKNKITIYNRWGNLIFESSEGAYNTKPWDGTLNGQALPIESYYFIIKYNDGSTTDKTGTVTIVKK